MKCIVITGGRFSGKSSAIATVRGLLTEDGYSVFIAPSAVQHLADIGVDVEDSSNQHLIVRYQLFIGGLIKGEAFERSKVNDKTVVLFDGAIMDGKAFCKDGDCWSDALYANSLSEEFVLAGWYDMVIQMPAVSYGGREVHGEGKEMGVRLREVWKKHENVKYIRKMSDEKKRRKVFDLIKGLTE